MGRSGLGDLVLTATGDLSRNRRVGQLLAQGLNLHQAVASLGHMAAGVYSARTVVQRARALSLEMPISECFEPTEHNTLKVSFDKKSVAAAISFVKVFNERKK